MFEFKAEQKTFDIGKVKIGGHPGQRPVVLIGSIFYNGHKIVTDQEKGEFDKAKAEELINQQDTLSDKTGNPCIVDVVLSFPSNTKYLEFVASKTDSPMLLDGVTVRERLVGLDYVKEVGLQDRIIYDSFMPDYKEEEIEKFRESGVKSALLLASYMKDFSSEGRIMSVNDILLPAAQKAGVEKPLVDTCTIDVPSFGQACKAIDHLKSELGYPTGSGSHNAVSTWRGLEAKMGKEAIKPVVASIITATAAIGADFVLYGPIKDATVVFPAVAMLDAAFSQLWVEKKFKISKEHPRYKIA